MNLRGVMTGLAVVVVAIATAFAFRQSSPGAFWLWALLPNALLGAGAAYGAAKGGRLQDWLRPKAGDVTLGVAAAFALVVGTYAFVRWVLFPLSAGKLWMASLSQVMGAKDARTGVVLVLLLVAVVSEELIWRGFVYEEVETRAGTRHAFWVSAGLYALAHVPVGLVSGPAPGYYLSLAALGAGVVWGLLRRFSGRLLPGVISHFAFDWVLFTMIPLWAGV